MHKFALAFSLCSTVALFAADTPQERLSDATKVFNEIMETPDKGIPQDLIEKANCIVIVPGMKQAALGIGGKWGRGYVACRENHRHWGGPAAVRVEGGSFGFQIGASNTDIVMLVMNDKGMRRLLEDKFTLGRKPPSPQVGWRQTASPMHNCRRDFSGSPKGPSPASLHGATVPITMRTGIVRNKVTNKEIQRAGEHLAARVAYGLDRIPPRER
jgi:hypothetical protein